MNQYISDKKNRSLPAGAIKGFWGAKAGRRNQKGFTLMEILVSLSVFTLSTLAITSVYMATLKAGRKTITLTRIQRESQLIMEVLAKKIRTSRVDYNYDYDADVIPDGGPGIIGDEIELALIDLTSSTYVFKFDSVNNTMTISVDGSADKTIPMSDVEITDLKFYINPPTNPWSLDAPPPSEPYVMMVMDISSTRGEYTESLTVQQTVPQRSGVVQ